MINLVIRLLITMAALKGADFFLDNFNLRGDFFSLFCFSIVLGLLNWFVKPILVFFSVPFIVLTIGFFYIIINALLLYVTSVLMPGVLSATMFGIFWGSVLVSIFHWLLTALFRVREKK
ncbi:phage holin family protein [bacterium]|nr:phage holin family protein [bacterium]